MKRHASGFTLIELLIVVAIIAILAAIAVPNFLEAQTRSKVSRVKADMRTLATALEAYAVDFNSFPPCNTFGLSGIKPGHQNPRDRTLERLSTPVAYITSGILSDPFTTDMLISASTVAGLTGATVQTETAPPPQGRGILYHSWDNADRALVTGDSPPSPRVARTWATYSGGPDRVKIALGGILASATSNDVANIIYNPTNGTVSFGDIYRVGGQPGGDPIPRPAGSPYGGGFFAGVQRGQ